jgi:hypothetical protein
MQLLPTAREVLQQMLELIMRIVLQREQQYAVVNRRLNCCHSVSR